MRTLLKASFKTVSVLLVGLLAPLAIFAQAQQPAASQDDPNQQLLNRLQELEKEVQALKAQSTASPVPAPQPAPVV
jgi:hypothetical protein